MVVDHLVVDQDGAYVRGSEAGRPSRRDVHRRRAVLRPGRAPQGRHQDLAHNSDGTRHDLTWEEDHAFWTWAIIEVLRATGIRIEELLELTHHSLIQYRLPTTGELVPLLQIAPSTTDTERLLVVSPDLAGVLAAIITRLAGPDGKIPLTARYDEHEHVWQLPAPLLFQRRGGTELRPVSSGTVRNMLNAALGRTGLTDAAGQPLIFTRTTSAGCSSPTRS